MRSIYFIIVSFLMAGCNNFSQPKTGFKLHSPSASGIDFINLIEEDEHFNIMSYEYIYNGGGIAVEDFNKDGLPDLFFTGNMVSNRLYLNQGNFKFKDISETAGIRASDRWSTGVAIADAEK